LDSSGLGFFEGAFHAIERLCRDSENFKRMNDRLIARLDAFARAFVERLRPPVTATAALGFSGFLQRVTLLLSSIFSPFEHAFLFPNTMTKLVLERIRIAMGTNEEALAGFCSAVVVLIDELRGTWIEQESVTGVVPPEFRQLSELIEIFGIAEKFQTVLLSSTERFYSNFAMDSTAPYPFLVRVKAVLDKEQTILSPFPKAVARTALAEARVHLYVRTLTRDMAAFVGSLVNEKQYDGLKLLSVLVFSSGDTDLKDLLISVWGTNTTSRAAAAFELSGSAAIIEELLSIHQSINDCRSFLDPQPGATLVRAFRQGLNAAAARAAFLLAQYCHTKISAAPEEFVAACGPVILLFRALTAMDGFVQHHRQFLALRLCRSSPRIGSPQTALRCESEFLRKIAAICGEEEVHNMDRMIEDFNGSAEISAEFPPIGGPTKFTFTLMTYDAWPVFPAIALRLPPEVLDAESRFTTFFKERQPAKKIAWHSWLDEVVFQVNRCQVKGSVIYFLFLKAVVTGEEFEPAGVTQADIKIMTQVLVKLGILRRVGEGLALAKKLPSKGKISLPIPPSVSPRALAEQTMEDVAFSRTKKVQAALVLVMKRLKIAEPDALFTAASKVVHFAMTKKDFDLGLAACIEGSFLAKRDEDGLIVFVPD
jgi:hypothetical protein